MSIQFNEPVETVIKNHAPAVKPRARIELAICRRLLTDLLEAGYSVCADNGEDHALPVNAENGDEAIQTLFATDESQIQTLKDGHASYILLVFGNDGYDLIADYGTSLDPIMDPILTWCDNAQDAGVTPA